MMYLFSTLNTFSRLIQFFFTINFEQLIIKFASWAQYEIRKIT